ncbi:hypothetical protein CQ017_16850 [Arthrobacter sp. MYb224]|uniref:hypothetical protein n=1 Tax=Arthrobacter sp. MYb224 TaxID=1848600 RepID=UPI000CFBC703|nr:hypothetical protein [Arthrobacter sp. MYb224]PQZ96669.1 hypothetical protein CQ017_16850 [Arthrobacter sp. MYb224]
MAVWHGSNWQLEEPIDSQTVLGVTFGTGLLDEALENTGSLATIVAVIRAELARPVELGPGRSSLPEVFVRVASDTTDLTVRGDSLTVAEAWKRLPALFASAAIPAGTLPIQHENTFWPADVLQRTGKNAAALTALLAYPEQLETPARETFARLNPYSERTPAVFYTNDASLIGHVYPVRTDPVGRMTATWADGTPKRHGSQNPSARFATLDPFSQPAAGNSTGAVHGNNSPVALSVLVPRSAAGLLASQILKRQLAQRAQDIVNGQLNVGVEHLGMGEDFCAIFHLSHMLDEQQRRKLIRDFATSTSLIPDAWIADMMAYAGDAVPAPMQRTRAVLGMAPDGSPLESDIREIIIRASGTLHAAVDPDDLLAGHSPKHTESTTEISVEVFNALSLPAVVWPHRYKSWAPRGFKGGPFAPIPPLVVGRDSIFMEHWQRMKRPGSTAGNAVETANLLAVLEDSLGNMFILDEKLRMVTIYPQLYLFTKSLRKRVAQRVAAATPRLRVASRLTQADAAHWRKRRRTGLGLMWGSIAAVGGALIGAAVIQGVAERAAGPVFERLNITEPAELANGTVLTTSDFEIRHPTLERQEYVVSVDVNICAGEDTKTDGVAPDTQRRISPNDFTMLNDGYVYAELVPTPNQLDERVLAPGECAAGSLTFEGGSLTYPRLAYENAMDDDVVWYSYGRVPEQFK